MFTEEQRQAVENFDDNILLLARAGTGKTFTVANKIAKASEHNIKPQEILCVTFTVKAAEEIKADVYKYSGEDDVNVFTIHGFCYSLIKEYAKKTREIREPEIADEIDAGEIIAGLLLDAGERGEYKLYNGKPMLSNGDLVKIISAIKHRKESLGYDWFTISGYSEAVKSLLKERSFEDMFYTRIHNVKLKDDSFLKILTENADYFVGEYDRLLRLSDLMDFDDLIFSAKAILDKGYLPKNRYKLVIVDEMQDTSEIEYSVVRKFFPYARVMMCGDEFQTIYSWRGSAPQKIIKDFTENFNAVKIVLSGNRRSSESLARLSERYLSNTFGYKPDNRHIGGLIAENELEILPLADKDAEAEEIFKRLKEFKGDRSRICVFARSNRYISELYKRLCKLNALLPADERLEFFTAEGDYRFYKRPVIKDFTAILRLLLNPWDFPSFERIATKYVNGVKRGFLSALKDSGKEGLGIGTFLCGDTYNYGDGFYSLIKAYDTNSIVVYDLETTGLDLEKDDFIQISAVKFGKEGISDEMNVFVYPEAEMNIEAEKTHGYGLEDLKRLNAVKADEALDKFAEFSENCVLVGHNSSSFDDVILERTLKRCGKSINVKAFYDTLIIAKLYFGELNNYKLQTLCEKFGVTNERAHDAFSDVTATKEVLEKMLETYILPSTDARRAFIAKNADKFKDFYEKYSYLSDRLKAGDYFSLVQFIGNDIGVLRHYSGDDDKNYANELYRTLKGMDKGKGGTFTIRDLLSVAALSGSRIDVLIKKYDKIPLITVHQAKGAEFDTVILAGADENEFPSYAARAMGEEDEEKRVFYVAITRAKRKLLITYAKSVNYGANTYERRPSPYLKNLR